MVFVKHDHETRVRAIVMAKLGWDEDLIVDALGVSKDSVRRWVDRHDWTGGMFELDYSNCGSRQKLAAVLRELDDLRKEDPTLYLDEYINWVVLTRGILVSSSTMSATLERLGLRLKQLRKQASQRNEPLHALWWADVTRMYAANQLVFIDECGVNNGNLERKRGRGLPGERVVVSTPYAPLGDRFSAIAAMTIDGYEALRLVQESVDGDVFYDFVEHEVLPAMNPFPMAKSVLVLDNASVHKPDELRELVEDHGMLVLSKVESAHGLHQTVGNDPL
ncbi:hypothetical protein PENSPDRAFT_694332 [Peniophora sp. CONT]|nr:hypothetical protein PENSPDRAFT_694332 [Peniophora sp. CONT]